MRKLYYLSKSNQKLKQFEYLKPKSIFIYVMLVLFLLVASWGMINLIGHYTSFSKSISELESDNKLLREKLQTRVLGPEYPMISKIKNFYIKNIMIKLEKSENLSTQKHEIIETINQFKGEASYKAVRVIVDVDPV